MTTEWYLVDSNVLSKLSREGRSSKQVKARCRIPTEVLHETRWFPDHSALRLLEYPVTHSVLQHLRVVMSAASPGETQLIDLYHNEGNGDPLLVATALDATSKVKETLFPDAWSVATDDRAVRVLAEQFEVPWTSFKQLKAELGLS